ncbi:MAG: small acid-soluble spore protein SspI [Tenericutes bacterium]|nr:small acid-soluble spore protein SspI [Mycoplasmatota bacterium]
MDINIRNSIINNFKNDDEETLKRAIDESISDKEEVTLPGLGVFFEVIWEDADNELKTQLISILKNRFNKK